MNKDQKLLFFDIDGTLLTAYPWTIPDSTQQALKAARKNGHLLFINSGRTYTISFCFPALFQTRYAGKSWKGFGKAGFPPALNDRIKFCMTVLPVICRMLYKS